MSENTQRIIIGSDHAGFELKEQLKSWLEAEGWQIKDVGCYDTLSVDYPVIAKAVAEPIQANSFPFGLLVCGSGVGVMIGANRYAGVRAVLADNETIARLSREHNDANVLCLGGRMIAATQAKFILSTFLNTPFAGGRHQHRVAQLDETAPCALNR